MNELIFYKRKHRNNIYIMISSALECYKVQVSKKYDGSSISLVWLSKYAFSS